MKEVTFCSVRSLLISSNDFVQDQMITSAGPLGGGGSTFEDDDLTALRVLRDVL